MFIYFGFRNTNTHDTAGWRGDSTSLKIVDTLLSFPCSHFFAGPKVNHMSGSGGMVKGLTISDELQVVWNKVTNEADPTTWVVCEYDSAGRRVSFFPSPQVYLSVLAFSSPHQSSFF